MENLARYIIRASFSQERMTYHRETGQVVYQSKDKKETKVFDSLEWLAAMCSHVPGKGEQMARYYGYYSPASRGMARGKRKKADADDQIPFILEPELTGTAFRKNWARLIQKIYQQQAHCTRYSGCGKNFPNHPPLPPAFWSGLPISLLSSKLATGVDVLSRR